MMSDQAINNTAEDQLDVKKHILQFGGLIVLAGLFYNAVLAFINCHGMGMNSATVAVSEGAIVAVATAYIIARTHTRQFVIIPGAFVLFFFCAFIWISIINQTLYPKAFRDMYLIFVFLVLGTYSDERQIINVFRISAIAVLGFMLLEAYATSIYVSLFQPARYFAATRGVEEFSIDKSGLFRNSLGYSGRFSFGLFGNRRLSSLFLEQVSIANYAMVLTLFVSAFWKSISRKDRLFFILTIILVILSNSSRTATAFCALVLIGYFIFPFLPRYSNILYMPGLLLLSFFAFNDPHFSHSTMSDDMKGRYGLTVYFLKNLDIAALFGAEMPKFPETGDSGYTYVIYTQTIFGLIVFWLFTNLIIPQTNKQAKRYVHGMSIYMAMNLMIGEAVFSIKSAALLWLVGGYLMRISTPPKSETEARHVLATQ